MSSRHPHKRFSRFFQCFLALLVLLLLAMPVAGQVRSARARVLQQPGDIMTTRKGNFQAGDILATSLISITISNDAAEAILLMRLKIEFGGDWSDDFVEASFIKRMAGNETFTFTNKDMLNYLGNIRTKDLIYHPILLDRTGIHSVEEIANLGSMRMPEGVYAIVLTVSEITLTPPGDINGDITVVKEWIKATDSNARVEFKVVTIGNLGVEKLPSLSDPTLAFKVPEIPVYDDAKGQSTSSTRVRITGPQNFSYSTSKQHLKSLAGSASFKGLPSDLAASGGKVVYDLGSVKFRAGETYSIDMQFVDWNGDMITSLTKSVSFPAPLLVQQAAVDAEDPFKPTFSWSFRSNDYSSWVKEYRLFVNGQYTGLTTGTSLKLAEPLRPGTTYSWYVMPYNRDGTPFFASAAGITQSLTTKAHTDLTVTTSSPSAKSILFKGSTYDFKGSAVFSDGAQLSKAVWTIGTDTRSGLELRYAPTSRYPADSLRAILSVTDDLGLVKASPALQLTVLDPAIALAGQDALTVDKGANFTLSLDGAKTRDLSTFEWFADGSSLGQGAGPKTFSFPERGTYRLYVEGKTSPDMEGTIKTVRSGTVTVTVLGAAPAVAITQPASGAEIMLGNSVRVSAAVTAENPLASTVWTVAGPDASQNGAQGSSLVFKPSKAGEYTLTCVATDTSGKRGQASVRILASDPSITITSPVDGQGFPLTGSVSPVISAPNAARVVWTIGDLAPGGSSFQLSQLGLGSFTLKATAYWNTVDLEGRPTEYSESVSITIRVTDQTPPKVTIRLPKEGASFIAGTRIQLEGSVESLSECETWWELDGKRAASPDLVPNDSSKRRHILQYVAKNPFGIIGSATVSYNAIFPAVNVTWPAGRTYLAGETIPIGAAAADASLFWLIDGTEYSSWTRSFGTTGIHTVQPGWKATADSGDGTQREFSALGDSVEFTIYSSQPPTITGFSPSLPTLKERVGQEIGFTISATGQNPLAGTGWTVLYNGSSIREGSGSSFSHSFASPGQYTIRARVTDVRGLSATKEWTLKAIDPRLAILSPGNGAGYGQGMVPAPVVEAKDLDSYSLILDSKAVGVGFDWAGLGLGSHSILANGQYSITSQTTPQTISTPPVNFSVSSRTAPSFTFEGMADGARILAGEEYLLKVLPSDPAVVFEWFKNGARIDAAGGNYRFTPLASEKEARFLVRASLNGMTVEKSLAVGILNPSIKILPPVSLSRNGFYPAQTPLPLLCSIQDVDRVAWTVDGQPFTGQSVLLNPGTHFIELSGSVRGITLPGGGLANKEIFPPGSPNYAVFAVASPLTIASFTAIPPALYTDEPLNLAVQVGGSVEVLDSISFLVDGNVYSQGKAISQTIPALQPGSHTITVKLTDLFGVSVSKDAAIQVFQPLKVAIAKPAEGARISPDTNVLALMSQLQGSYARIAWYLDDQPLPDSNLSSVSLGKLSPGTHTIGLSAWDLLGKPATAQVRVEVQSDFRLNILSPASDAELILGSSLACLAGIEKTAGSDIDLADAAASIAWYVAGKPQGTGLSFDFQGSEPGARSLKVRYEKGDMVRESPERTVTVRDIADPVIRQPPNGASLSYAPGATIKLSASGEPGAAYVWSLDGNPVAFGPEASFNPQGLGGQKLLRLTTSAFGRSKDALATINLAVNQAPTLNLAAPPLQFTGQALAWTASAFDPEDRKADQAVEVFLDGAPLAPATPRILGPADVGAHSLTARTRDSLGAMTAAQVPILVEPSIVPVEIQSPIGSKTYYVGTDIGLAASLGSGISLSGGPGTFTWTIQYLDDPQAQPTTITSAAAQFSPAALGDLALSLRYTDAAGRERGAASLELRVEAEPRGLSLEWPHGAVVNAGVPLVPKLLGVPADVPARFLRWTLNGASLPGIEGLTAPLASGVYTLAVEYTADASPQRAEQVFTVNAAPVLSLDSPAQGQQYATGTALVLSARVEDDQPFTGSILWFAQDAALGEGSPLVVSAPAPGQWRLKAQAADQYGASSSSEISFLVYEPVSGIAVTVNGGQPFYSIYDAGPPMEARISFSGGIEPLVQWTLRQGEANIVKTGVSVGFSVDELQPFSAGQAALSLLVTDPGLADEGRRELFRRDYPIELFKGSLVLLARPAPEDIFHVGEDIPFVLALDGFLNPTIRASLNGREMELAWARAEGSAQWLASIPGVMIAAEGAYDLVIGANENGKSGSVSYTLNVYRQRVGIFIDDAPATFDLRGQSLTIHAQTSGLEGVDNIRWLSDLSPGSIGSGTSLDLGQAGLSPGARSITVQARAGERVLASATCSIRVFGPMELIVGPIGAEEVLIFQKGGQASLEAEARDKDGSALGPEAITWTSHLDGLLGRGGVLNLGAIAGLSGGDHILTIQAMGADGESINAIRRIRVRIAANESGGADQDEGGSDGSGGTDSGGDKNLDEGEEIRERERANREPTNAERAMQAAVEAALSRAATAAALRRIENALNVIQMRLMQARSQNGSAALISRLTTLLTQVTAFRQGAQRGMQKVVDFARRAAEEAAKAVEWETRQVSARARSAADAAVRYAEQADEQAGLVEDAALRAQEAANLARTL